MRLLVFGLGYVGRRSCRTAAAAGITVVGTTRSAGAGIAFAEAAAAVARATHVLSTVPPDKSGDPVLARYGDAIAEAPELRWIGYLSTTGVYGDRGGGWVDEDTDALADIGPRPTTAGGRGGLAAVRRSLRGRCVPAGGHLRAWAFGVRRSARGNRTAHHQARPRVRPHPSRRIVRAVMAAMRQDRASGARVLNLVDDEPAESADVVAEAARLLGVAAPEAVPFERALAAMTPMARSFWAENRKVSGRRTQQELGLRWLYPSYREGLRAILAEERGERLA